MDETIKDDSNTVGEFSLVKVVGEGSFGSVYLAKHLATNAYFAIKKPKRDSQGKPSQTYSSLFAKEASILKQLSHRNVIRYYKTVEEEGECHVVLEFVSGIDLGKVISKQRVPFSEREAAEIMKNILNGLTHVHSKGIVHRDLKPSRFC
jgi:serine/threonine protein kinase